MASRTLANRSDGKGKRAQTAPVRPEVRETVAESRSRGSARLYPTKNDLPETTRVEVIGLLNQRLAECIDLQLQSKQAHWNVKGLWFVEAHQQGA